MLTLPRPKQIPRLIQGNFQPQNTGIKHNFLTRTVLVTVSLLQVGKLIGNINTCRENTKFP